MKVIIIEDEKLAVERLKHLLRQIEPDVQIIAAPESVEQSVSLFRQRGLSADLLLPALYYRMLSSFGQFGRSTYKSRLLGRIGQKLFFIHTADIAFIAAENRIVQVVTTDKTKYLVDHTLEQLEQDLDPASFFRINRSMIVHAAAVAQIKPFLNHRLRLVLKGHAEAEGIIVSRDRVAGFKKWADS